MKEIAGPVAGDGLHDVSQRGRPALPCTHDHDDRGDDCHDDDHDG